MAPPRTTPPPGPRLPQSPLPSTTASAPRRTPSPPGPTPSWTPLPSATASAPHLGGAARSSPWGSMEPKIGFGVASATQSEFSRVATSFALAPAPSAPFSTASVPDLGREAGSSVSSALLADLDSSSQLSASPTSYSHHSESSSSPSLRSVDGGLNIQEGEGKRWKKRKSPCTTMLLFRSPLSRMLLSPQLRSPTARLGRSPLATTCSRAVSDIDLNLEPHEDAPENAQNGSDIGGDPCAYLDDGNGSGTGVDLQAQESARRRVVVPDEKRRAIFESLIAKARNGNLKGHETNEVSEEFSVPFRTLRTVQRIWKRGKSCLDQGLLVDVSSGKSRCGRKKIEVDVTTLCDLPFSSRTTMHDVAQHFGISKSKLQAMKREGIIKRVSNSIKPYLTEKNKKDRLKWCLSMLDPSTVPHDPKFQGLFDYVFIDEKWFYITRKTERYYTVSGEEQPTRTCKSKNFIPKIMILTIVARPRFDSNSNCTFDGKIGCFPFVTYEPAKRSSANRPAGTIEMKPIDSVKKEVIRDFMIDKVLPAIRVKWPPEDANKPIFIQQDNARPHLAPNDKIFCEAAKQDGFDMRLVYQPANSPDFNVLDLGFFNSIQSIQYKTTSKTTEELVAAVDQAFERYSVCQANRIFLTLHGCMKEVMKIGGNNGYDVPHIGKGMLERQGCLPLQLKCDARLVQDAMAQINE